MSYVVRQPNGLLCRFSSVTDCPTHWNMTEGEYVALCMEKARDEARDTIKNSLMPFERLEQDFAPNNMTNKVFQNVLEQMKMPVEEIERQKKANAPKIEEVK